MSRARACCKKRVKNVQTNEGEKGESRRGLARAFCWLFSSSPASFHFWGENVVIQLSEETSHDVSGLCVASLRA